jgi:hypothetical protein
MGLGGTDDPAGTTWRTAAGKSTCVMLSTAFFTCCRFQWLTSIGFDEPKMEQQKLSV